MVISHNHFDHTGGLAAFLEENSRVRLILPPALRGVRRAREIVFASREGEIYPGIYTTGELESIEQSLAVETRQGLILLVGCSHPDMATILETAGRFGPIAGIIGGLHGFQRFELLEGLDLICPTHCTQYKQEINARFPSQYREGGAGIVIEVT